MDILPSRTGTSKSATESLILHQVRGWQNQNQSALIQNYQTLSYISAAFKIKELIADKDYI